MTPEKLRKQVLIVVRTYPVPAQKGVEVSCTAAITDDGQWIRIFPVPYRFLDEDKKFQKYQWVEVEVTKASNDTRHESYKLVPDSIRIVESVPTTDSWRLRKEKIYPLRRPSLCAIVRERETATFPTLGFFKPKQIKRLEIRPENAPDWSQAELEMLRQGDLFRSAPKTELEKIPLAFRYEFACDDPDCRGHKMKCTDWEMGQTWRKWRNEYGDKWESKFRQRWEADMIRLDTHFFVGTLHGHPGTWIIVGVFYPPIKSQTDLFIPK